MNPPQLWGDFRINPDLNLSQLIYLPEITLLITEKKVYSLEIHNKKYT
jgi:hypothetical protein